MTVRHILVGGIALAALVTAWGCQPKSETAPSVVEPKIQTASGVTVAEIISVDGDDCRVYRVTDSNGATVYLSKAYHYTPCTVATK